MVEFGLKLEDNKVSDWADEYIDYETLKAILDKLKTAQKKRDELIQRRPDVASEIQSNLKRELDHSGESISMTRSTSMQRLSFEDFQEKLNTVTAATTMSTSSEKHPLLHKRDLFPTSNISNNVSSTYYGTQDSSTEPPSNTTTLNLPSVVTSTTARVAGVLSSTSSTSGYMSFARYEKQLLDALQQVEELHCKFQEELLHQVQKVNTFYQGKYEEMEKRLTVLVEGVDGTQSTTNHIGTHFPKKTHRPRLSMAEIVVHQLKSIVRQTSSTSTTTNTAATSSWTHIRHSSEPKNLPITSASPTSSWNTTPVLRNITKKPPSPKKLLLDDDEEDIVQEDDPLMAELRESESIQRALSDQYRICKLLRNFAILNYTGFVKIAKKFDKLCPDHIGKYKDAITGAHICNEGSDVEALQDRMETIYANWFCDGNVREATAQLLPKRGDGLQMDWSQLRLGYRLGMCAILTLWVCWDCIWGLVRDGHSTIGGRIAFPVFRGCGGLLLLHWFWGVSVYTWTRFRINYIFLFDLNPKIVSSPISIFNDAVDETLVFLVLMLLYYKAGAHDIPNIIPTGYIPAMLVLYTIYCLIFPLRTRVPMWKTIFHVLSAPFVSPTFFTIYIADVFTSMVKVFQDIAWTICFMISGDFLNNEDSQQVALHQWQHAFWYKNVLIPLICLFPLWIRFNQCLRRYTDTGKRIPNIPNAFKYAMSQMVTLFGAFHPLYLMHRPHDVHGIPLFQLFWMAIFVASSLYSFCWDVFMDWGLGDAKYAYLSQRLMFPHRSTYYCVIVVDIVLRFMWVLTLVPPQSGARFEVPQYLTAVTMALELMRRTIWGFFRLENEHRSNTSQYRRVSFVPLHFSTGHQHKYNQERQHVGWAVLLEVGGVSAVVICISIYSVIAAQCATKDYSLAEL
jgi:xenotropic and polytropic retrovirus receptor 1